MSEAGGAQTRRRRARDIYIYIYIRQSIILKGGEGWQKVHHFLYAKMTCNKISYRLAQRSKPPPIFRKIVLKIANEIRFLRKFKV